MLFCGEYCEKIGKILFVSVVACIIRFELQANIGMSSADRRLCVIVHCGGHRYSGHYRWPENRVRDSYI